MSYFKKFFGHLKTLMTHKHWVFYYACSFGRPWMGLVHDLSKFSPEEFFESVRFWDGKKSPILAAKEVQGISRAWLHHKGRNKHHYEYWLDYLDDGGKPMKIPFKYVIEMVCDWLSASRTYNGTSENLFQTEYAWWQNRSKTAKIHPTTKRLLDIIFWNLAETEKAMPGVDDKVILKRVKLFLPNFEKCYNKF